MTTKRWMRARAWANGQSTGPYGQGVPADECERIEALRDRILEVGELTAFREITASELYTTGTDAAETLE